MQFLLLGTVVIGPQCHWEMMKTSAHPDFLTLVTKPFRGKFKGDDFLTVALPIFVT